jgi:hypothetical protein
MAKTYAKGYLQPIAPSNSYLSLYEREMPEAASQTFPEGSPLKFSSGLLAEFVNPTDGKIAAISLIAGQNTTGALTKVVLTSDILWFEANFLGAAAADNVLAAADVGTSFDLAKSTTLLGTGYPGWYLQDATSDVAAKIGRLVSAQVPPQSDSSLPAVGDTNARVQARILDTKSHWN